MRAAASDWRVVAGTTSAWFDTPSLSAGAAFAARVMELAGDSAIDVRQSGVRVRLPSGDRSDEVSEAARGLGLTADPSLLQQLGVVVETSDAAAVTPFWQQVLGYELGSDGRSLVDSLSRDPTFEIRPAAGLGTLRNRIHADVVRSPETIDRTALGAPFGAFGVCHRDHEGNEVDLVPGDPLDGTDATEDWRAVFGAMACYRTGSSKQRAELVATVASLADEAGFPLLIDVRPGWVVVDSGKDQWFDDVHGLDVEFVPLAIAIQSGARELGAVAETSRARFVQLFFDAADVATVRAFWVAALGYVEDRRSDLTDIHDPNRLNPVIAFQPLDVSDVERRQHRNRIHIELAVPTDEAESRVERALGAGGTVLDESPGRWHLADPESNELVLTTG